MSQDTRYNGWRNYETWAVNLWLDNEEPSYRYWTERTREIWDAADASNRYGVAFTKSENALQELANALQDEHEEGAQACGVAGVYSDLLNAALSEVDWREIAEALLDTMNESLEADVAHYEARP